MSSVTIFGHSFAHWLQESGVVAQKGKSSIEYKFVTNRGLTWQRLFTSHNNLISEVIDLNSDTVVVIMGTNDICDTNLSVEDILKMAIRFEQIITNRCPNTKDIFFVPVSFRAAGHRFRPGQTNLSEFTKKTLSYNTALLKHCQTSNMASFLNWKRRNNSKFFRPDGLHLNYKGNRDLFCVVQQKIS